MAAYDAHQAGETPATFDALVQALNRLVAFQMRKPQLRPRAKGRIAAQW
jgi:phage terminase large subunit-like protein